MRYRPGDPHSRAAQLPTRSHFPFSCSQLPCTSQPSHPLQLGHSVSCYQGGEVEVVRALPSLHPRTEGMMPTWSPHPAGWSPHLEAGRRNKGDRAWALPPTCPGLSHERDRDILSFSPFWGGHFVPVTNLCPKSQGALQTPPQLSQKVRLNFITLFSNPSSC